ncbi:hypothetical protein LOTGIDRAFT_232052 [Lottia gigantea]|uniref:Uncharacterized protein n=1 Tax=Lottia gigantea TaxID=225164 RepID=V4C1Q0_LOTGI|nr:hypothetical protein LOTGIDRAFT_232052 [Lottia gigantea]ESO95364.1 hypothetical protein LOTGIDRAFT_232052 [Lottia gigantea]
MVFPSNHPKMHACVDSLYTIDGDTDKSKIMDIIRVMKGALSVSKSKTGDVIYRSNKNEVKILDRQLAKVDKDVVRAKTNIECQKRDVLRKWSLVFGNQKTLCESIKSFDEMINSALEKQLSETEERSNLVEQSLNSYREEEAPNDSGHWGKLNLKSNRRQSQVAKPSSHFGKTLSMPVLVNPNESKSKAVPRVSDSTVPASLPKINTGGSFFSNIVDHTTKRHKRHQEAANKKGEFPDFSRSTMESYFDEQKQLHEELMTRNSLNRLKSNIDGGHNFYKLRIRTKLPEEPTLLIESIETDRTRTKSFRTQRNKTRRPLSVEKGRNMDNLDEEVSFSKNHEVERANTYV